MEILSGLERLRKTCVRLNLALQMIPPAGNPPAAGSLIEGQPLDPLLAAFYKRWSRASFATDKAGIFILPWDTQADINLQTENRMRQRRLQEESAYSSLLFFAGEPNTAYRYATMPELADERGYQPVVYVDMHEEPHALPMASNVDLFFDLYARYLEELVAAPGYEEEGEGALLFPWMVPHLVAHDRLLVQMLQAGRFDSVMKKTGSTPDWVAQMLDATGF